MKITDGNRVKISDDDMTGGMYFTPFHTTFFCGQPISLIFNALTASMQ
jgi:hypothetical protein